MHLFLDLWQLHWQVLKGHQYYLLQHRHFNLSKGGTSILHTSATNN